ncbi:MAG: hypothetical protein QGG78_01505, partial [Acidimicrobiales bacterium]|nr:hypothetical protein [Acidimicrobiales bacterium]
EVRRHLPPHTLSHAHPLPAELRDRHRSFMEATRRDHEAESERRARHVAVTLVDLGEGLVATERQLRVWRFEPALCLEAAGWAWGSRRHPSNGHPSDQPLDESPEGRAPEFLPTLDGAA